MKVGLLKDGRWGLRCFGQSTGELAPLRVMLDRLAALAPPSAPASIESLNFAQAIARFAGTDNELGQYFTKEKSNLAPVLSRDAITNLLMQLANLPAGRN